MQSAAFEGVSGWVGIGDDGVRNNYSFEIVATSFSKRLTHVRYPKMHSTLTLELEIGCAIQTWAIDNFF